MLFSDSGTVPQKLDRTVGKVLLRLLKRNFFLSADFSQERRCHTSSNQKFQIKIQKSLKRQHMLCREFIIVFRTSGRHDIFPWPVLFTFQWRYPRRIFRFSQSTRIFLAKVIQQF